MHATSLYDCRAGSQHSCLPDFKSLHARTAQACPLPWHTSLCFRNQNHVSVFVFDISSFSITRMHVGTLVPSSDSDWKASSQQGCSEVEEQHSNEQVQLLATSTRGRSCAGRNLTCSVGGGACGRHDGSGSRDVGGGVGPCVDPCGGGVGGRCIEEWGCVHDSSRAVS
jgi:hypothetical protein